MYKTDKEMQEAVGEAFRRMDLPVPEQEDVYRANSGSRRLVLMTDFGIVARVTGEDSVMGFTNRHFLKSLFQRKIGDMYLDLDPGIQCPATREESNRIFSMMRSRYSIEMTDKKPHNCGFIPGTNFSVLIDLSPNCLVKVDPRDAGVLTRSVRNVKKLMQLSGIIKKRDQAAEEDVETVQDIVYRDLRRLMKEAWPEDRDRPDRDGMRNFLNACVAYRRAGKLLSCWANKDNDYGTFHSTTDTAASYAGKLRSAGITPNT